MLHKIARNIVLIFLILLNGTVMLSCSQEKVQFENVEVEITDNHCLAVFDDTPLFKVTFDADIELPVLPEYCSVTSKKVSLTVEEIKRLISICIGSDSVDLFGQWDLSKQELMTMFEKAEPYIGTEKVSSEYIKWLTDSINVASGSPIRRQISTNDIPSGIPVLVYGKDDTNSPPALLYFVIDGDFLFWYQRNEFIEIIPESMTAEHQYDPNYETEGQFIRKKPETPSISQDSAYTIATQYLDTIGADLNLYSVEKCSFLSNSAIDKETGWMFVFTRKIFSLQTRYEDGWTYINPEYKPVYVAPWASEVVKIAVDSKGLCSLMWQGASKFEPDMVQTVSLLPVEKIPHLIANTFYKIYEEHQNENGIGLAFEVTDMKLGMSLVSSNGKESGARLIPSWYIYYNKHWCDAEEYMVPNKLILSAIDGSYIEPRITTDDIR